MPGGDVGQDEPGPKSERVAEQLRRAIARGEYRPGDRLPSQGALAHRYAISRPTVQLALKELESAGLLRPMQRGRRAEVADPAAARRRRPPEHRAGLEAAVSTAFEADTVALDFFGFTGETLYAALQPALRRMRRGELAPGSVRVRLMVPGGDVDLALPRAVRPEPHDARPLERMRNIRRWHCSSLVNAFAELRAQGGDVTAELRTAPLTPQFKMYVLNRADVLVGLYRVEEWDMPLDGGETVRAFDVKGFDAELFAYSAGAGEGRQYASWFESMWHTIAAPND